MVSVARKKLNCAELAALGLASERLPRHVAIIMDGNGRWAVKQGLPRIEGHRRGVDSVREIVEACAEAGVEQLTLYCLSSENWKRPQEELELLMELLEQYLVLERPEIVRQGLQFSIIGRRDGLSDAVLREVAETRRVSEGNTGMHLCLALNYGGRGELVDAVTSIASAVREGTIDPDAITEQTIADHLYTAGSPDPDLMIRTAGEMRVSNFLLWQISYAEFWVTQKCWPDFRKEDLYQALRDFGSRDRRFGGLND